jgi:maltoporin
MASSQIIYQNARNALTEGQIANWRNYTYTNLGVNEKFSLSELQTFMDIECLNIEEEIIDQLKEQLILGEVSHEDLYFVLIDSCVMCTQDIQSILSKITKNISNNAKIVLIDSHIGKTENNYKLLNPEKYSNIDMYILENNLAYIKGQEIDGDVIMTDDILYTAVLKTNFYLENKILTVVEDELMDNNQWERGSRNEANDNAQILLMEHLLEMIPDSNGIIVSNDKLLIQKVDELSNNSDINLMYFNP